jgi:hypothetical protein
MEYAVAVAFETRAVVIGFFGNGSVAGADSASRPGGEKRRRSRFTLDS